MVRLTCENSTWATSPTQSTSHRSAQTPPENLQTPTTRGQSTSFGSRAQSLRPSGEERSERRRSARTRRRDASAGVRSSLESEKESQRLWALKAIHPVFFQADVLRERCFCRGDGCPLRIGGCLGAWFMSSMGLPQGCRSGQGWLGGSMYSILGVYGYSERWSSSQSAGLRPCHVTSEDSEGTYPGSQRPF